MRLRLARHGPEYKRAANLGETDEGCREGCYPWSVDDFVLSIQQSVSSDLTHSVLRLVTEQTSIIHQICLTIKILDIRLSNISE